MASVCYRDGLGRLVGDDPERSIGDGLGRLVGDDPERSVGCV